MDDDEFLDRLYQAWSKTTDADQAAWAASEDEGLGVWEVWSVEGQDRRSPIVSFSRQADAEFIAVVHSGLPALIRRFREALDESERLDIEKDTLTGQLADTELALQNIKDSR
ncbi:hypothetical protein F5X71_29505 [Nocardia brasiliensis]|uniref:Uncharacterized protein n=1 Tax=Nocardia brasiliensis TaxID=37326 RepID=A0A6G9XYA4_NOCBR|nr:hypothetical protein [Nocardia brasiliensis]QIS05894.1 hypothetical protein F5X71_29505 [Nocardia brasiliensis]